jgi:DNA end-binding protein Ku
LAHPPNRGYLKETNRTKEAAVARAIWTGSVSFGLVSIPVKLFSATEQKDVRFHELEEGSGKRIHHKRVAGRADQEVDYEDIVKGYEVSKGSYVVVTPKELEAIQPNRSRTIEIEDFVELAEIDPIYFEKTYYLVPDAGRGAEKPYALLLKALDRSGKVGIGTFVLRTKQYLAAIRPSDQVLALETMYFADEVRTAKDLPGVPVKARVSDRELAMAKQLIDSQDNAWDPKRYRDTYRQRVLKLVRDKANGKEIAAEREAEPAPVKDIMEALRASVEAAKAGEKITDIRSRIQEKQEAKPRQTRRRRTRAS